MDAEAGPRQLLAQLTAWAQSTPWCDWLELGGSLGRGAGDAMSDIDAGIGVAADYSFALALDEAFAAAKAFAPVAGTLIQSFGRADLPSDHVVIQYLDGRQLSLVVAPAASRPGLPPGSQAVLDRGGQLSEAWQPESLTASRAHQYEWGFLAWWAIGDVAKHVRRGSVWRAITALDEARRLAWQLHAAALGVDYPSFGAVSVENAGRPAPAGLAGTLPAGADPAAVLAAVHALAEVLTALTSHLDLDVLRATITRLLVSGPAI